MEEDEYFKPGSFVAILNHDVILEVVEHGNPLVKVLTKNGELASIDKTLLVGISLSSKIMEVLGFKKALEGKKTVYTIPTPCKITEVNARIVINKKRVNNIEIEYLSIESDFIYDPTNQGFTNHTFKYVHQLQDMFGLDGISRDGLEKTAFKQQDL